MAVRGRSHLTKTSTFVQLVFESISEDVKLSSETTRLLEEGTDDVQSVMMTRAYQSHPHVEQCLAETGKWPVPIALYADAARYSRCTQGAQTAPSMSAWST
eukprot:2699406-Pyramimonas_sp.AAC.1